MIQVKSANRLLARDWVGRECQDRRQYGKTSLIHINAAAAPYGYQARVWQPISSAPFDRDLEIAVLDRDGPHALVFACRRILSGWINAETKQRIDVRPTHWREWGAKD